MNDKQQASDESAEKVEVTEAASATAPRPEPPNLESISAWARKWLLSLFDLRFQRSMVLHALPAVYIVMIGGGAIYTLYIVGAAFTVSLIKGVVWVVLGPVVFLAGLSLVRAVLEFFAAVLRMAVRIEAMQDDMQEISSVPKWLRGLNPMAGKDDD